MQILNHYVLRHLGLMDLLQLVWLAVHTVGVTTGPTLANQAIAATGSCRAATFSLSLHDFLDT